MMPSSKPIQAGLAAIGKLADDGIIVVLPE
jgi:hypothetical protein